MTEPALITDAIRWLSEHTVSWSLECDPEHLIYQDRADYLDEFDWRREDAERAGLDNLLTTDHMYEARAYPTSAVGFVLVFGTTAHEALTALISAVKG